MYAYTLRWYYTDANTNNCCYNNIKTDYSTLALTLKCRLCTEREQPILPSVGWVAVTCSSTSFSFDLITSNHTSCMGKRVYTRWVVGHWRFENHTNSKQHKTSKNIKISNINNRYITISCYCCIRVSWLHCHLNLPSTTGIRMYVIGPEGFNMSFTNTGLLNSMIEGSQALSLPPTNSCDTVYSSKGACTPTLYYAANLPTCGTRCGKLKWLCAVYASLHTHTFMHCITHTIRVHWIRA